MKTKPIPTATSIADFGTIYESSDNGQRACGEHKAQYGRIPWRKLARFEVMEAMADSASFRPAGESLCEICSHDARIARAEARRAAIIAREDAARASS